MYKIKMLLISLAVFALFSCSDDNTTTPTTDKVKVAALIDLSGHYSQFGIEAKQAMELALAESKNIEVQFFDTKADLDESNKLLDQVVANGNYNVVVTLASWISNGLAAKIKSNNMLQMAIGIAVFDYPTQNNCIRLTGDVSKETEFLSNHLKKYNRVAVLFFNNEYGIGWNNALKSALGSNLVKSIFYTDTEVNFSSQLNEVKSSNPDAIVLISTKEAVEIVKQAAALNLKVDMFGVRPTLTNQLIAEPNANGLMFSYPNLDESKSIFASFKTKYGYRMSAFGAEGYDLVKTLDQYYQNNKKSDVIFTNYKNKTYNGALGQIKFNENGQADYDYTICVIKNGTWEELK